jgi:DNA repair protein RadC
VHLREVVRRCLVHNAAAVIFAHNHPSGIAEPSQADKEITVELKRALRMIDVRVHDHLVIGSNTTTSLAQLGLV